MIIKAVEELAQVLCEVSPRGGFGRVQILLPEEQWQALETELRAKAVHWRLYAPPEDVPEPTGPTCIRLYVPGGEVTIRKAVEKPE